MSRIPELLAGLDEQARSDVLALAAPMKLEAGAVLFRLGDEAATLYLIERGLIALTMPMQVGGHDNDVLIEERGPGETLGWSTLIPPHRFTLKAVARVPTDLLAFPRAMLLEYSERRPDVGYLISRNVAALVGQRLQVFQDMWLRQMQHVVNLTHV
jgi:CRP-like cAMP-binding protein